MADLPQSADGESADPRKEGNQQGRSQGFLPRADGTGVCAGLIVGKIRVSTCPLLVGESLEGQTQVGRLEDNEC